MSVVSVTEMWSKRGGSGTANKLNSFANEFNMTAGYQVEAEIGDHADIVLAATGIPAFGMQHPSGLNAFVESKEATPMGPILWLVTVGFKGDVLDDSSIELEWTDSTTSEAIDRDINGEAILTANNEQVEGLSVDIADQVVMIRRKFVTINTFAIANYRRAVNSDTFLGWPPGTARLMGFSAKNTFKYNAPLELWDVTARIQFRKPYANTTNAQAWDLRWRHEGLIEKGSDGILRRALDEMGQESSRPVLLKADGTRETNPSSALFVHTKVTTELPYSGLGLI